MSLPTVSIRAGMVLATISLAACASGGGEMDAPAPAGGDAMASADMLALGAEIFQGNCQLCHGPAGTGGRGPALNDDEWVWIEGPNDPEAVATVTMLVNEGVSEGRTGPNAMMPALGMMMSEEEVDAVVAYVLSLSQ